MSAAHHWDIDCDQNKTKVKEVAARENRLARKTVTRWKAYNGVSIISIFAIGFWQRLFDPRFGQNMVVRSPIWLPCEIDFEAGLEQILIVQAIQCKYIKFGRAKSTAKRCPDKLKKKRVPGTPRSEIVRKVQKFMKLYDKQALHSAAAVETGTIIY